MSGDAVAAAACEALALTYAQRIAAGIARRSVRAIEPGMTRRDAYHVIDLAMRNAGITRTWHTSIVGFDGDLLAYAEPRLARSCASRGRTRAVRGGLVVVDIAPFVGDVPGDFTCSGTVGEETPREEHAKLVDLSRLATDAVVSALRADVREQRRLQSIARASIDHEPRARLVESLLSPMGHAIRAPSRYLRWLPENGVLDLLTSSGPGLLRPTDASLPDGVYMIEPLVCIDGLASKYETMITIRDSRVWVIRDD